MLAIDQESMEDGDVRGVCRKRPTDMLMSAALRAVDMTSLRDRGSILQGGSMSTRRNKTSCF